MLTRGTATVESEYLMFSLAKNWIISMKAWYDERNDHGAAGLERSTREGESAERERAVPEGAGDDLGALRFMVVVGREREEGEKWAYTASASHISETLAERSIAVRETHALAALRRSLEEPRRISRNNISGNSRFLSHRNQVPVHKSRVCAAD